MLDSCLGFATNCVTLDESHLTHPNFCFLIYNIIYHKISKLLDIFHPL